MEVMEHAPKTRAERLATLRTEAALLIAKIAEARRLSAGDPLAALRLAAKVGAAMLWAVHQVEIGPTEEEGLISLHGTLSRAGHLPRSLEQPVNVLWLYHRETKGELSRSRLYSSRPWPVCFAALARLGAWFFVDYLSLPLPPELEPLPGEGARPALRLVGRERAGGSRRRKAEPECPWPLPAAPASLLGAVRPSAVQVEAAERLGVPPVVEDERTGIVLVLIPGGEYWMGASFGDGNAEEAESPRRRVRVPPFYLGAGPVMQAEWLRLMETNPSTLTGDRRPVDRVSWLDAQEFLRRANEGRSGPPLRLPIEAEWELAARGGTDTAYWWGPEYRTGWMNCSEDGFGSGIQETTDVGRFPPNPFGLFDILGNRGEWCQDLWKKSYRGAPRFATPQPTGDPTALVIRGGSWLSFPENARVSSRYGYGDKFGSMAIGFRCAQSLPSSRKARHQADERSLT